MTEQMSLGLRIPEDLSVSGYDNRELSGYYRPPLTTVTLPLHDIGYRAAEIMIDMLEKKFFRKKKSRFTKYLVTGLIRNSVEQQIRQ